MDADGQALMDLISGLDGEGNLPGQKPGTKPGKGGITRGPGTAPITLSDDETQLGTRKLEGVTNDDLSNAFPGDVIDIGESEHEIDETIRGPKSAGAVESTGAGGDAIWKESLLPDEKKVLREYFK